VARNPNGDAVVPFCPLGYNRRAMSKELAALLALHAQDSHLRRLEERLDRLLAQKKQLEETVASEEQELAARKEALEALKRRSRERAAEVDDLDTQIRKYQQQLDEGLLSFKEMEALREKVQSSRTRMEALEEEAIALLDEVEREEAAMREREAAFRKWHERMAEELAEIDREIEAQRRNLEAERTKRETLAQEVDAALRERYERLLREYENPVVPLREGRCTGCRLQVSEITVERVREGREIVACENCLRILYAQ